MLQNTLLDIPCSRVASRAKKLATWLQTLVRSPNNPALTSSPDLDTIKGDGESRTSDPDTENPGARPGFSHVTAHIYPTPRVSDPVPGRDGVAVRWCVDCPHDTVQFERITARGYLYSLPSVADENFAHRPDCDSPATPS